MNEILNTKNAVALKEALDTPSLVEVRLDTKRYPHIADIDLEAALTTMTGIVANAYMMLGKVADREMVNFTATTLLAEINKNLDGLGAKNLSFYEVSYAIRRAIMTSDQMFTVSVASLYRALKTYIQGEGVKADAEARAQWRRRTKISAGVQACLDAQASRMAKNAKL